MDKEEFKNNLKQLVDIRKEIENIEVDIKKTEPKAIFNDKVRGSSKYFPYSLVNYEIEAVDKKYLLRLNYFKSLLRQRHDKALETEIKVTEFINTIDNSKLRQIFHNRYINQYSWTKIGFILKCTGDSARIKHDRFLEKM